MLNVLIIQIVLKLVWIYVTCKQINVDKDVQQISNVKHWEQEIISVILIPINVLNVLIIQTVIK